MSSTQWYKLPFEFVSPGEVLAAGIVLPIVCIVMVAVRFQVRRLQKARLGIDDVLIALGVVMITGMGACLVTGERLGVMGYPTPVPTGTAASEAYGLFLDDFILQAKIQFALQFLMCFAYGFVKTSILFFCRRIFLGTNKGIFNYTSLTLIALSIAWSVGFLITLVFGCGKRVDLHWAPLEVLVQSGCDASTPQEAMVISDFILDVIIIALPIPVIWRLNMSVSRKTAVTAIFMFGLMSVAASAARMSIYLRVLNLGYGKGYDINRTATTMLWWSMLEVSLAAIAACLPTLNFLLKELGVPQFFSRLRSSAGSWSFFRSSSSKSSDTKSRKDSQQDVVSVDSGPDSTRVTVSNNARDSLANDGRCEQTEQRRTSIV